MKESKFIELLNLYVDHQISPEDAALLEAEVRSSPERRVVYRQYCQMQKACVQLGEAFRTEAPEPAHAPETVAIKPRRTLGWPAYAGTLVAAAACLALVFVVRSHRPVAVAPDTMAQVTAPAAVPAMAATTAARPVLQPVLGPRSLNLRETTGEAVELASNGDQVAFGDWMNDVRLSSMETVSIDDLHFDGRTPLPANNRAIRTVRPFQGKVEMAAVRFQK